MKIIRVVKKDENNVVVYLDNGEKLYLTYEVFLKNGLRKDKEIPDGHFDFLIKENQKYYIKSKAYSYIARRHHSVFELRTKLRQKKYDNELIEIVLKELVNSRYLDDAEFAGIFTEEKIRLKLWGKNKIKAELFKKGIDSQIISTILAKNFPEGNDVENAIELGKKKYISISKRDQDVAKIKQKLYSFLSSRGYDYQTSKEAIEIIIGGDKDEYENY